MLCLIRNVLACLRCQAFHKIRNKKLLGIYSKMFCSLAQCIASPTAQGASPTCEAMFTKLLTILEEVKETQHVHGKMLNVLLKKQNGSVVEVPEGVVLPLKTQADLEALDQKLGDHTVMSAVVS